jgi:hypothetical protein
MEDIAAIDLQTQNPSSLKITGISEEENRVVIHMKSQKHRHCCPVCG